MTKEFDDEGPGDEDCWCGRGTRLTVVAVCERCGEEVDECQCEELDQ